MGIDSTFTLRVYADRLESTEGSLSGRIKTAIPMSAIDTYTCGYTKPVQWLVIGVILLIATLRLCLDFSSPSTLVMLSISAICFVAYFLMKCMLLTFTTSGANGIFFLFKRSVIEGVNIDEALAERVMDIVKRNYIAQVRK